MSSSDGGMESSSEDERRAATSANRGGGRRKPNSSAFNPGGTAGAGSSSSSSSSDSSDSSSSDSSSSDDEEAEPVAPITDAREVTLDLSKLNASFSCKLCGGYLRDAHTLMDCLHTFCKACLERHIVTTRERDVVRCPVRTCHTTLIATHPMRTEIRYDRAMQNLVDKLLPQFVKADEELKRKLELQYGGGKRAAPAAAAASVEPPAKKHKFGDDKFGHEKLMIFELRPYVAPSTGSAASTAAAPLAALPLPFVKTSSKVTVRHLRKFVAERLSLPAGSGLDLQCSGEVLGHDHSIEFIWRTRWHHLHPNQHLVLTYRAQTHHL